MCRSTWRQRTEKRRWNACCATLTKRSCSTEALPWAPHFTTHFRLQHNTAKQATLLDFSKCSCCSEAHSKEIMELIVEMVVVDMRPLSMVECEGFFWAWWSFLSMSSHLFTYVPPDNLSGKPHLWQLSLGILWYCPSPTGNQLCFLELGGGWYCIVRIMRHSEGEQKQFWSAPTACLIPTNSHKCHCAPWGKALGSQIMGGGEG